MQLVIGNKNYSSWSMRPWVLLTQAGIAFDEVNTALRFHAGVALQDRARRHTPAGRVPVLVDEGFAVWDTLAIVEYLHERFPDKQRVAGGGATVPALAASAPRCTPASARCAATSR
jgi:glutathione S-transferase